MEANPYEAPQTDEPAKVVPAVELPWYRRRKPLWGCPAALGIGVLLFVILLGPLAVVDDCGTLQMAISAFMALVIYVFLF